MPGRIVEAAFRAMVETAPITAVSLAAQAVDSSLLPEMVQDVQDQILILSLTGLAGAFVNATFAPKRNWKDRLQQAVASTVSAMCLGALLAFLVMNLFQVAEIWAFAAGGFLMGFAGREGVEWAGVKIGIRSKK